MFPFDPSLGWKALEERLARAESPRRRALLRTVINHSKAEAAFDLDGLMATLVDEPQYHFWVASGVDVGPKGYDAVRRYYHDYVRSGAAVIQSPKDRIVVDDDHIAHEGVITTLAIGRIARQRGYRIDDERAHYALRMRNTVLWSFDENACAYGEDTYSIWNVDDFVKLRADELPPVYLDYLAKFGLPR